MAERFDHREMNWLLRWCMPVVGPCELAEDDQRLHGRSSVARLKTAVGPCYLKIHRQRDSWEREVHAYDTWGPALGALVPKLLAVHQDPPLALLVAGLPGRSVEDSALSGEVERAVWRGAGQALARFHGVPGGQFFGPCRRDGSCATRAIVDPVEYVSVELGSLAAQAKRLGRLNDELQAVIRAAQAMAPALAGERPVLCHRDYHPANWIVGDNGAWAGTFDFEFSAWDVSVADFARYPNWEWMRRPHLVEALLDGYGGTRTARHQQQLMVMRVHYALSAITWGCEHSYFGFADEGRQAIEHLGMQLG